MYFHVSHQTDQQSTCYHYASVIFQNGDIDHYSKNCETQNSNDSIKIFSKCLVIHTQTHPRMDISVVSTFDNDSQKMCSNNNWAKYSFVEISIHDISWSKGDKYYIFNQRKYKDVSYHFKYHYRQKQMPEKLPRSDCFQNNFVFATDWPRQQNLAS